jgi:hypothetical protein
MDAVEQGYTKMRKVTVKKDELLAKLIANREKHIAEYNESVEGYRKGVKERAVQIIEKFQQEVESIQTGDIRYVDMERITLVLPESHERDYDQVIEMLQMSIDATQELQSDEFACYVMDRWKWKESFASTNALYKSMK